MSLRDWTLWVIGTGVSLIALTFAVSQYFNQERRKKVEILKRGFSWGGVTLALVYVLGAMLVVETVPKQDRSGLPPNIELSIEFPVPEEFPPKGTPLTRPVTELYLWKNTGGPIYHREAQIVDSVEAVAGRCGELDSFKRRMIPLLNPNHYASVISKDQIEGSFFVSPRHDRYFNLLDDAVYGIQFDARGAVLEPYGKTFEEYLQRRAGLCGYLRRHNILVRFAFSDVRGHETSFYYRFGQIYPFETLSEAQWTEVMSQITDLKRKSGYTVGDLADPCRILSFINGGSLTSPCSGPAKAGR
jgi:hypothetical protein